MNVYTDYPQLVDDLPRLVRRQRRLERQIAAVADAVGQEKTTRSAIDALLVACGFKSGDGVLCLGYEVKHNERKGQESINRDKLLGAGVAAVDIAFATETGNPAKFATVRPEKGAKVRK